MMLTDVDSAVESIRRAAAEAGFRSRSSGPATIDVDIPFSFRKNIAAHG
jgi:hypothetical protein